MERTGCVNRKENSRNNTKRVRNNEQRENETNITKKNKQK